MRERQRQLHTQTDIEADRQRDGWMNAQIGIERHKGETNK